jgi:CRP-like cAMP-binding protein
MRARTSTIPISGASLRGCRFFDDLDGPERERIASKMTGLRVRKGTELVRHGDRSDDVYFVLSGAVEASNLTREGREVSFQVLGQGEMFGELSALDGETRSASVVAEMESSLLRMPGAVLRQLVATDPRLARQTYLRLCALARLLCEKAFEARALNVPNQVRREIYRTLRACDVVGGAALVKPAPTHADLARRVGTNRSQVTRVFADLRQRGHVATRRGEWLVADMAAALDYLREHYRQDPA